MSLTSSVMHSRTGRTTIEHYYLESIKLFTPFDQVIGLLTFNLLNTSIFLTLKN